MAKKMMGTFSQAQVDAMLSNHFPEIVRIMKKVRTNITVNTMDKSMIEQQLIILCGALHYADKYALHTGMWRESSLYSPEREAVRKGPTIQDETIFTIVSSGKRLNWVVYIDLPIEV